MADQLSGSIAINLAPPTGGTSVAEKFTYTSEAHTKNLKRSINLAAGVTDFEVDIVDMATVAMIMMQTDNPFSVKYNSTGATSRTCRRVLVDTPNNILINKLFITTTTLPVVIDLFVVGD